MNMMDMMQKTKLLQEAMKEMQANLEQTVVVGESGGGMVKVKTNCKGDLKGIEIDGQLLKQDEKRILEDLIVAAFNNAKNQANEAAEKEMQVMNNKVGMPLDMIKKMFSF
jgi:DNA-binding YbaB/EbfC family protein